MHRRLWTLNLNPLPSRSRARPRSRVIPISRAPRKLQRRPRRVNKPEPRQRHRDQRSPSSDCRPKSRALSAPGRKILYFDLMSMYVTHAYGDIAMELTRSRQTFHDSVLRSIATSDACTLSSSSSPTTSSQPTSKHSCLLSRHLSPPLEREPTKMRHASRLSCRDGSTTCAATRSS